MSRRNQKNANEYWCCTSSGGDLDRKYVRTPNLDAVISLGVVVSSAGNTFGSQKGPYQTRKEDDQKA